MTSPPTSHNLFFPPVLSDRARQQAVIRDRVEMSAEDAKYMIPAGWTKLAEWSCDGVACRRRGPAFAGSMRVGRDQRGG
jgi:hypothetical protein